VGQEGGRENRERRGNREEGQQGSRRQRGNVQTWLRDGLSLSGMIACAGGKSAAFTAGILLNTGAFRSSCVAWF
jgi:hypothetical protein